MGNSQASKNSKENKQKLHNLTSMGFPEQTARAALESCDGNFDAALAQLLNPSSTNSSASAVARQQREAAAQQRSSSWRQNSGVPAKRSNTGSNRRVGANGGLTAEQALQKAIQESMKNSTTTTSTTPRSPSTTPSPPPSSQPLSTTHLKKDNNNFTATTITTTTTKNSFEKLAPKGLTKLSKVLAPHPVAMDTIIKIIRTILTHPNNPKYRQMKWENKLFSKTVKSAPGAIDFLKKIGFEETKNALILKNVNEGLLLVAMQMLERRRSSSDYKSKVGEIEFDTVVQALLGRTPDNRELEKRKVYENQLPTLPEEKVGTQTLVRIVLGSHTVERRFRTDNTLNAAVNFLGSLNSLVPTKIDNGEWVLVNTTTFPEREIDLETDRLKTFYALEMWPSAWLTVRPRSTN